VSAASEIVNAPATPAASATPVTSVPPAFSVPAPAAFIAAKPEQVSDAAKTEKDLAPENLEEGDQQKLI
jgi:hypothetical protein